MKIGIMGGTFNPIHHAHIALAQQAYEQCKLDKVLFIPTGNPYLKTMNGGKSSQLADAKHRLEMTKLAIAEYPDFCCSTIEIDRPGATYTADTLRELSGTGNQYYFIMGEDSFLYMKHWKEPQVIFDHAVILVAARPNEGDSGSRAGSHSDISEAIADYQKEFTNVRVEVLHTREQDISSTEIRRLLREQVIVQSDITLTDMVPANVLSYIRQHHLYEA